MKILMVCMGNICRSPLAEVILKDKLRKHNINVTVESAGTIGFHEGEGADQRARETARRHMLSLDSHSARAIKMDDFNEFDKIYVMDSGNYHDVRQMAGYEFNSSQIDYLMNEPFPGQNQDVPDPYYGGKDGFERVFNMLEVACTHIATNLKNHQPDR